MKRIIPLVVCLALGVPTLADFFSGFEPPLYNGSAAGVVATGQDGWYLPSGIDQLIFTYAGNAYGFPVNPYGGEQFLAGRSQGGANLARAQHDNDFTLHDIWAAQYDIAANWSGTLPAAINLSSFSMQPDPGTGVPTNKTFIALNNWMDPNNPALGWKAEYNVYNAAGSYIQNQSPGPAFTNLLYNHWYRQTTKLSFSTNQILSVTMTDLTTLVGTTYDTTGLGWYVGGGANSNLPLPTAFRFFVGGAAGNTMGFDRVLLPEPGALALLLVGLAALRRR